MSDRVEDRLAHLIMEDIMPRKRTRTPTDTPPEPKTTNAETDSQTATTATLDPLPAAHPESAPSFVERLNREPRPTTPPDPFGIAADTLAGVRLFESRRDRVMAIGFDEKPSPTVLDRLKDAGYRWNPRDKVWVMPVRPESARTTRIEAERLYQEVSGLIRSEKGVETGQEVPF
jgi:hypothetical protein